MGTGGLTPVEHARRLRNLFSGIAGRTPVGLEEVAMRASQARERAKRRAKAAELQAAKRKAAVERRKLHQMQHAEYARDRRATADA